MSITIRDLNLKRDQTENFTYQDIDTYQISGTHNELALYDLDAIRNSINNIFLIKRGTRILDPEFGSDLDVFLFEPINNDNARLLGESVDQLLKQEPRILTDSINVNMDIENSSYVVDINFIIPSISNESFGTSFSINQVEGISINNTPINN